jgi:uncharacterized protein (TIGR02611 family)
MEAPDDVTPPTEPASGPDGEHHHGLLYEAAIEAELETGEREATEQLAQRHVLFRLARMATGFMVLILGILAIPLPGPGWLIVGLGLGILAQDFVWAERTLNQVRKRLPQDEDGRIAPKTWVIMGVMMAGGIALSVWWSFFR